MGTTRVDIATKLIYIPREMALERVERRLAELEPQAGSWSGSKTTAPASTTAGRRSMISVGLGGKHR